MQPDRPKHQSLKEVCVQTGVGQDKVLSYIRREWIVLEPTVDRPPQEQARELGSESLMDEEDIARLRLILELQQDMGVNDEGVEIILRLLDQIHALRLLLSKRAA